jgi:hypothetical protein
MVPMLSPESGHYCTQEYAKEETRYLAEQIAGLP